MFRTISTVDFRKDLSAHLLSVQTTGERILITKNGKDAVALVSVRDLHALEHVEGRREEAVRLRHQRMLEEFRALKDGLA